MSDYRQSKEADATLYQHKREAEGMLEMAKGYRALIDVFGGAQSFMQFQMMENGTYEKLAKANGQAINGLQPKITSWNTGKHFRHIRSAIDTELMLIDSGGGSSSGDPMTAVRDVMQNLPPLLETIHEQTGITPPLWMPQLPAQHDGSVVKSPERNGVIAER